MSYKEPERDPLCDTLFAIDVQRHEEQMDELDLTANHAKYPNDSACRAMLRASLPDATEEELDVWELVL